MFSWIFVQVNVCNEYSRCEGLAKLYILPQNLNYYHLHFSVQCYFSNLAKHIYQYFNTNVSLEVLHLDLHTTLNLQIYSNRKILRLDISLQKVKTFLIRTRMEFENLFKYNKVKSFSFFKSFDFSTCPPILYDITYYFFVSIKCLKFLVTYSQFSCYIVSTRPKDSPQDLLALHFSYDASRGKTCQL